MVAVNWQTKSILLGECKWGTDKVVREVVSELIDKKHPCCFTPCRKRATVGQFITPSSAVPVSFRRRGRWPNHTTRSLLT